MKRTIAAVLACCLCAALLPAIAGQRQIWGFQGSSAFFAEDGKIGLLHKSANRLLLAASLDEVRPFFKERALARHQELWGLLDPLGRWIFRPGSVIPIDFGPDGEHGLYSPDEGLWGFINPHGFTVLEPAPYLDAGVMSERLFAAQTDKGYGYVSDRNKVAVDFQYDKALPFSQGLAAVEKDGKWGYINQQGEPVLPFTYFSAGRFAQSLAPVTLERGGPTVYINPEGKVVLEGNWHFGAEFTKDKLARVEIDGKYGYINPKGKVTISARYADAHEFGDGFAPVKTEAGDWVFINTKGKIVSKNYLNAGPYQNGYAFITYQDPKTNRVFSGYISTKRNVMCELMEP